MNVNFILNYNVFRWGKRREPNGFLSYKRSVLFVKLSGSVVCYLFLSVGSHPFCLDCNTPSNSCTKTEQLMVEFETSFTNGAYWGLCSLDDYSWFLKGVVWVEVQSTIFDTNIATTIHFAWHSVKLNPS